MKFINNSIVKLFIPEEQFSIYSNDIIDLNVFTNFHTLKEHNGELCKIMYSTGKLSNNVYGYRIKFNNDETAIVCGVHLKTVTQKDFTSENN